MLEAPKAPVRRIAELGAGTGIATELLLRESAKCGPLQSLQAFDPSPGMLSQLVAKLGDDQHGLVAELKRSGHLSPSATVTAAPGAFDTFDAGDAVDLVVVAQAWHWCPDFNRALAHIAASLRPGGVLALLWNLEDRDGGASLC